MPSPWRRPQPRHHEIDLMIFMNRARRAAPISSARDRDRHSDRRRLAEVRWREPAATASRHGAVRCRLARCRAWPSDPRPAVRPAPWASCAVVLHGGPGSGGSQLLPRFVDPAHYRIVCPDQRGTGGSRPRGRTGRQHHRRSARRPAPAAPRSRNRSLARRRRLVGRHAGALPRGRRTAGRCRTAAAFDFPRPRRGRRLVLRRRQAAAASGLVQVRCSASRRRSRPAPRVPCGPVDRRRSGRATGAGAGLVPVGTGAVGTGFGDGARTRVRSPAGAVRARWRVRARHPPGPRCRPGRRCATG